MINWGGECIPFPTYGGNGGKFMVTISSILMDINRGILANNMIEHAFSYRLVYFVNENGKGTKFYADTSYTDLRNVLENIIKKNLTVTNNVVVSAITVKKDGKSVSLLSRAYAFSLDEYFEEIVGKKEKRYSGRRRVNWA